MEKNSKIDLKDRRIIATLDMNGRMALTKLAKTVKLSREVVAYRLKRLHEKKVVVGTVPIFDSAVVGQNWYRVLFRLLNITKEQKQQLINHLTSYNNILWLGELGGNWDLIMNFVASSNNEFNNTFESMMKRFGPYIRDYEILIYVDVYDLERTYILPTKRIRKSWHHTMKYDSSCIFDTLTKNIIKELSVNGAISNVGLGQKLGVSGNTIKNRINQMQEQGLLLGFRLWSRPQAFNRNVHMLFLAINRLDLKREQQLYTYLKTIPQIAFLVKHIGKWRIGLEIEAKDAREFQEIFVEIRGRFSDIITDFEAMPLFKDLVINYFPAGALE